ncbi:uncharacterized protein [Arachis hypogaea]|uniref:uncharacterized protein n=1 Tax=Arachis hypogaea TaxID=3818 RepID=UPI003B219B15
MELLKDYNFELSYHPRKVNLVADALNRKSLYVAWMMLKEEKLLKEFEDLNLGLREVAGKVMFWWPEMKNDVALHVSKYLTFQKWKLEDIAIDFVSGLPRTRAGFDAIWVIVDRLTKSTHFLPFQMDYTLKELARLYIKEIVRLYGVPTALVSDKNPGFTSRF